MSGRRRADAQRNVAAILDAAVRLLEERQDPTMAAIAGAAGVTRQTVYAHFASREALFGAALERAFARSVAAVEAARLDEGTAAEALGRLLEAGWEAVELHARILETLRTAAGPGELDERHRAVMDSLLRLARRGQRSGEFDRSVPAGWLVATAIGLVHTAAQEVAAGRMPSRRAVAALRRTVLRAVSASEASA